MPTIGWFEILIIVTVAILVVGPKDFPFMLKKIGSWIGSVKKYVSNVQNEVNNFEDFGTEEKNTNKDTNKNKQETEIENGK
jgi:sec-independent protein translocase protein TatB